MKTVNSCINSTGYAQLHRGNNYPLSNTSKHIPKMGISVNPISLQKYRYTLICTNKVLQPDCIVTGKRENVTKGTNTTRNTK